MSRDRGDGCGGLELSPFGLTISHGASPGVDPSCVRFSMRVGYDLADDGTLVKRQPLPR